MPYPQDQLLGKSGQNAAIAEFLRRGYNVALPEVDLGDDFLVLDHRPGGYSRIQIKTATPRPLKTEWGFHVQFLIPLRQLHTPHRPPLFYILAARLPDETEARLLPRSRASQSLPHALTPHLPLAQPWEFLIIARKTLRHKHRRLHLGSLNKHRLMLCLTFRRHKVTGHGLNLQPYRNNFTRYWPPLQSRDQWSRRAPSNRARSSHRAQKTHGPSPWV